MKRVFPSDVEPSTARRPNGCLLRKVMEETGGNKPEAMPPCRPPFSGVLAVVLVCIFSWKIVAVYADGNNRKRVGIVGAGGYIGSRLHEYLIECGHDVIGYDRDPKLEHARHNLVKLASHQIDDTSLRHFDVLIYLGGLTGRVACDVHSLDETRRENVHDPVALARRLTGAQTFIFASTSAIMEGYGDEPAHEDFAPQEGDHHHDLLDRYSYSMLTRERAMFRLARDRGAGAPQLIGLRFGTVIGNSIGQRTDLSYMALVKSAVLTGVLHVTHRETWRAYLWLEDQIRAIESIAAEPGKAHRYEIFHLASFGATIGKAASTIAMRLGARVHTHRHDGPDKAGFTLNASRFASRFGFEFKGTNDRVVTDLEEHLPGSVTAKGAHRQVPPSVGYGPGNDSMPCPVCGGHHLQTVLDLGEQPLANDFRESAGDAQHAERHPLKLMRCRTCNHMHLSKLIDRKALFSDYLYQSGTSATLLEYFEWLAAKIVSEAPPERRATGTVIEIASNDGSQLDKFKAKGWATYGVDPAANLVPLAEAKGHKCMVGFWGTDAVSSFLPPNAEIDAIVGQNVLAHVPSPVAFLKACRDAMGPRTRLYLQTSQCQMHQEGQFDTAYHEHISFFTGHSFRKAAELSGLEILDFELTPIHGTSCLVTFQRGDAPAPATPPRGIQPRIDQELTDLIHEDIFYEKFNTRAQTIRQWLDNQLTGLFQSGYQLGLYGAAAKGMVLLNYILAAQDKGAYEIDFVVDDAPLKQNRFCPGTRIPVWPTARLKGGKKRLAITVLAWNFYDEIARNIQIELTGTVVESVILLVPFPQPHMNVLEISPYKTGCRVGRGQLTQMPFAPVPIPNALLHMQRRSPVILVSHFFNEELLLPYWIEHHAPMFDKAILIDYSSTDRSVDIINRYAPPTWEVVKSKSWYFDAEECDKHVAEIEVQEPDAWHIALTTTEFLVHPNFRGLLATIDAQSSTLKPRFTRFPAIIMAGNDSVPLDNGRPLLVQRSVYAVSSSLNEQATRYRRILHAGMTRGTYKYAAGRHGIRFLNGTSPRGVDVPKEFEQPFIAKYMWTPWPESRNRKRQIGAKIPDSDKRRRRGYQHTQAANLSSAGIDGVRKKGLQGSVLHDLKALKTGRHFGALHAAFQQTFGSIDPPPIDPPCLWRHRGVG